MSRETVRIALLIAVLNNIDIWAADVLRAYITMPFQAKIWTTLGKEFGDDCGKKAIVVPSLCGLKSSGTAFRVHLAGSCERWVTPCAPQILTYGSRNRQTRKEVGTIPISSVMLTLCWWSTTTPSTSWTRSTAFSNSSITRSARPRCTSGEALEEDL
eukprot:CCRYP_002083-RA/>CCRYP_002083-RA protein AED:0.66 eAED:0.23 QI:0/-1/0/1/-1/0/1/0/156